MVPASPPNVWVQLFSETSIAANFGNGVVTGAEPMAREVETPELASTFAPLV